MERKERSADEIQKEIDETRAELEDVHGTETEVYARIVGYYRAVKNWNRGKRDEFDDRKSFILDGTEKKSKCAEEEKNSERKISIESEKTYPSAGEVSYELFTKKSCPNCPPVTEYMENVPLEGKTVDVSTEEGLSEAASKGVFSSPTVILYGAKEGEIGRAHNVDELAAILESVLAKEYSVVSRR